MFVGVVVVEIEVFWCGVGENVVVCFVFVGEFDFCV